VSPDGDGSDPKSKSADADKPADAGDVTSEAKAEPEAKAKAKDKAKDTPKAKPKAEDSGVVAAVTDIPPTRKHEIADEPPQRQSALQLLVDQTPFPDDGSLSGPLRAVDRYVGMVEQIMLMTLLLTVVGIGAMQALSDKLFSHSFDWSFDAIRGGTFAIAMLASAYASQQGSHLSMDLVTRRMRPRGRLVMRIVLGLVTIFAAIILVRTGLQMYAKFQKEGGDHFIPAHWLALLIPIGGGLIILHTVLRIAIDADYLVRAKLPPEKAPTGH
jgi:TRAP-type C4-dicarboxylate transport system permease small subunit